jgi:hypothetical protein
MVAPKVTNAEPPRTFSEVVKAVPEVTKTVPGNQDGTSCTKVVSEVTKVVPERSLWKAEGHQGGT